jgi:hypothetical protein
MRKLMLTLVLSVATLGSLAVAPSKADAAWGRWRTGYYSYYPTYSYYPGAYSYYGAPYTTPYYSALYYPAPTYSSYYTPGYTSYYAPLNRGYYTPGYSSSYYSPGYYVYP